MHSENYYRNWGIVIGLLAYAMPILALVYGFYKLTAGGQIAMHKKQYEELARAIKENLVKPATEIHELLYVNRFVVSLCDILAADNKSFNREKFMEAIK